MSERDTFPAVNYGGESYCFHIRVVCAACCKVFIGNKVIFSVLRYV
jgi:hypothetical protein